MASVNRCVAIIKVKQPFIDWLKSLPDPEEITIEEVNLDNSAFLLPEYEENNKTLTILKHFHNVIFEEQLMGWWTNQDDWPKNRGFNTFVKWFDVEFHSIVFDLVDEPLLSDAEDSLY